MSTTEQVSPCTLALPPLKRVLLLITQGKSHGLFVLLGWSQSQAGSQRWQFPSVPASLLPKCQPNSTLYEGKHVWRGREFHALPSAARDLCLVSVQGSLSFPSGRQILLLLPLQKQCVFAWAWGQEKRTKKFPTLPERLNHFALYEVRIQGNGRVSCLCVTGKGFLCSQFLFCSPSL